MMNKYHYLIVFKENKNSFISELKEMSARFHTIGKDTGARQDYFKLYEGKHGDGIRALYDDKKLK